MVGHDPRGGVRWGWSSFPTSRRATSGSAPACRSRSRLEAGSDTVDGIRAVIRQFPEVETVVSQHGRPDDGTDATGFFNAEFFVPLKPFDTGLQA